MAALQLAKAGHVTEKNTVGKLRNSSQITLSLAGKKVWEGSQTTDFPKQIEIDEVGEFTHDAVDDNGETTGSIAALKYKLTNGISWIVAWSNPIGKDSKVITEIVNQPVHWEQIKVDLDARGKANYSTTRLGYTAEIDIDPKSRSPIMRAYIQEA